jgi:predicted membrane-bound spermidine synthase
MGNSSLKRWYLLFALFFMSGISGLIYESIWSRYIKQLVGSAATAQILVLALFMGGMSIGALLSGRLLSRTRVPVVAYGIIEGLIGLYALAFPTVFAWASRFAYDVLFPALGGGTSVGLAKWAIAGSLILPACILLGMTFPLMSVGILRRERTNPGQVLAILYFTNSLGAAFGAMLSGFGLVPSVGLPGALMVGAALNIFIMLLALTDRKPTPRIEGVKADSDEARTQRNQMVMLYLAVAFGTGLSSFMYEIGWIRLLSMILGSATHSFEVMLSAFVFGLALGGFWVRKRMDRFKRPELALAVVQMVMGLSAIATLPAYLLAVQSMGFMMDEASGDSWFLVEQLRHLLMAGERTIGAWYRFNILRYLLCLLIMLPATFCAGMTLPLLTHVMLKRGQPEGAVGQVYGVNTMGAIIGAVMAGLVLMPLIRLKGVIVIGALVDLLLGLALIRGEIRSKRGNALTPRLLNRAAIGAVFVTIAGLVFPIDPMVLTATVFRHGRTRLPSDYDILSYVDGRTASVTVVDNTAHDSYHIIYTNGKPDASVILDRYPADRDPMDGPDIAGDEPNQFLVGLIPLMAKPDSKHGALIGFGSGVTCHTILGDPYLERLDTVEIEREMVKGSRFFMPVNYRAYTDDRSHIWFDDAKAYFAAAGFKYDFIVSEPTNPWVSGVSSLFTVEFYREAKRYLKEGGVLAQWLQGYELSDRLLISVLAAIDQEFEDYLVVRIGSRDWVILSSPDRPIGQLSEEPLEWAGTQEAFEMLGIHDVGQIDGLIIANKRMLHPFLADETPNRDSHPILDTGAERERFLRSSAEFLHSLRWTPAPLLEVMGHIERRPYPREGIGDWRDPHILYESEQAQLLMRRFDDPEVRVPMKLSGGAMANYRERSESVAADGEWDAWLSAVYEVYRQSASHFDVHRTVWWKDVLDIAANNDLPDDVALSVELMDAMSRRDGVRLWKAVEKSLPPSPSTADVEAHPFPIPLALRTIAGMLALELRGVSPAERQAFADLWMKDIGNGEDSEDLAYQVIYRYGLRP